MINKNLLFFIVLLFVFFVLLPAQTITGENNSVKANRLINEKSPYLLQHAYNPVNWYPWGPEAFERAKNEGKAIFLSIGYSTCHWCHVMAHESFEDPAIAALLNTNFICIKVDREERPDIDRIYMAATQAMTGSGGWPMSLFLFPDGKPFYAGTYFPPKAKYGRPGFPEIIEAIQKAWNTDRQSLLQSAQSITRHLQKTASSVTAHEIDSGWLKEGFDMVAATYDQRYAGFGSGNKFPRPVIFNFLLRYHKRSGNKKALEMARKTLRAMAKGGIYDHLGGGFHRYSVDSLWRVPHFEKMLYDQAQLITAYLELYQVTANPELSDIAKETIDYVLRDMRDANGGFYSAEDADSDNPYSPGEKSEGAFYLWKEREVKTLLGTERAKIFAFVYGIEKKGNTLGDPGDEFGDTNVFYRAQSLKKAAVRFKMQEQEIKRIVEESKRILFVKRQQRIRPHLDDKIITGWNGLMITALVKGGLVLDRQEFLVAANRTADFLMENLMVDGRLKRRFREGDVRFAASLEDYAFLVQGLLDLYGADHNLKRLRQAIQLTEQQIKLFADKRGGFFDAVHSDDLPARMKGSHDGAEPAGNSVAVLNLIRLGRLTGNDEWLERGRLTIESFGWILAKHPSAMVLMLSALDFHLDKPRQIVVSGNIEEMDTQAMFKVIHKNYLPNTMILLADGGENQNFLASFHPFLQGLEKLDNKATAYVCEDFVCQLPTNDTRKLAELLEK